MNATLQRRPLHTFLSLASLSKAKNKILISLSILIFSLFSATWAQTNFNANTYYQQCLRFEAGGDLETARQSCLNATLADPELLDAALALARIEVALGDFGSAEARLQRLKDSSPRADAYVLLADIALSEGRFIEAESFLDESSRRLAQQFDTVLAGRQNYLEGQLAERRGDYVSALERYQQAIAANSLEVRYRLVDASLRFELGDLEAAKAELEAYQSFSGIQDDPQLLSLLGHINWAMSDLTAASRNLEAAVTTRSSRDPGLEQDLRDLALVYYGQGSLRSGGIALREAQRRGDLLPYLLALSLPWLLVLLALLALHLIGESRIGNVTSLEVIEGPERWTVGQVYGILFFSVITALVAALAYSYLRFQNYLAIATPIQGSEVRALFLAVLMLMLLILTFRRVQANGWRPLETLLGSADNPLVGLGVGIVLLAVVLVYLAFVPDLVWLRGFYLDFSRLSPLLIAAIVTLPLAELYFRAFAIPALAKRYDQSSAVLMSGALYALVLASPLLLVLTIGLSLSQSFSRKQEGFTPMVAQLTLHLGLILGVAFNGWVRGLFL